MRWALVIAYLLPCFVLWADDAILRAPAVRNALRFLETNNNRHTELQVRISEIPAPTFHEAAKADFIASEFRRIGLKNVEIDGGGNVLGWRPGRSNGIVVLSAHLDISFTHGVDTKVKKAGKRWFGPGLADDSRGLAAMIAVVEALDSAKIETERTLLLAATVGEEGLGNLKGIRHVISDSRHRDRIEAFIGIDGTNPADVVNGGLGVKRYKFTYSAPGGHSWGNFGRPSAAHALGFAIARFAAVRVPSSPKTTYNVGRLGGGTAVNAIAEESWMEVDLRSESPVELKELDRKLLEAVQGGADDENGRRAMPGQAVSVKIETIGDRPAGTIRPDDPLVVAALWASEATGHTPALRYDSTDANFPISPGISSVNLGGGGRSDNEHSLQEWFEPANAFKGPQCILLTLLRYDRTPSRR